MNSFEDLEVWKECRVFKLMVKELVKSFPEYEKYRMTDQIIRSSRSINTNISEGYGRFNYLDNVRFCRIGRGSLNESLNHLIDAFDESYFTQETLSNLRMQYIKCLKLLNGYIAYLLKAKKNESIPK